MTINKIISLAISALQAIKTSISKSLRKNRKYILLFKYVFTNALKDTLEDSILIIILLAAIHYIASSMSPYITFAHMFKDGMIFITVGPILFYFIKNVVKNLAKAINIINGH